MCREIPYILWSPYLHYRARKVSATGPWPKPDECHPLPQILLVYLRYINTILPTSFRSLKWPLSFKILYWSQICSFLSHLCHVSSSFISLSACYFLANSVLVNNGVHHFTRTVPSSLLLRLYSTVQIFSSSVYSPSPSPIFFLQCETQSFTPVQKLETKYVIQKPLFTAMCMFVSSWDFLWSTKCTVIISCSESLMKLFRWVRAFRRLAVYIDILRPSKSGWI